MEADWYVDPLGRYDGRYFDGESWTAKVSAGGVQAIDQDWAGVGSDVLGVTTEASGLNGYPAATDPSVRGSIDPVDELSNGLVAPGSAASAHNKLVNAVGEHTGWSDDGNAPAVAQLERELGRKASVASESPARTVAVLDRSLVRHAPRPTGSGRKRRRSRWSAMRILLGCLALVTIGLAVLYATRSDEPADEQVVLDASEEDRVADLQDGGVEADLDPADLQDLDADVSDEPGDLGDPEQSFAESEAVGLGDLRVVNGESALTELATWHQGFAQERGVELPSTGCWFARLGDAGVGTAACGPVGGSGVTEYLYDLVPLRFDDVDGGQLVQPDIDGVMIDEVLAPALELVGAESTPEPPKTSVRGGRLGG